MTTADKLVARAEDRTAIFGVIGLGYVGLPLAVELAEAGYHVVGFDVSERVVATINGGTSHVKDVPSSQLGPLVQAGRIEATTDMSRLGECDAISICVPTPLSKTKDPDVSYVVAAANSVVATLRVGQAVILESTTYPGTTRELLAPRFEQKGLVVGRDVFLAFSPERVDPGNPTWHTRNTPKVLGTMTPECARVISALYSPVFDRLVPVSSPEAAELVKLLENTFRSVNIGLVNEMAIVCDKLGVDVWEVIEAAATKPFGFMKFVPGPGVGGHCIPLDPFYLSWKLKSLNYRARFIELAGEINSEMPAYVVRKVTDALNDVGKSVRGSRVLLLGVAYKNDVSDMRESPALDIQRLLEEKGAHVEYHDPHVPTYRGGHDASGPVYTSVPLTEQAIRSADVAVVTAKHKAIDFEFVARHARIIVDSRNAYPATAKVPGSARIVRL